MTRTIHVDEEIYDLIDEERERMKSMLGEEVTLGVALKSLLDELYIDKTAHEEVQKIYGGR